MARLSLSSAVPRTVCGAAEPRALSRVGRAIPSLHHADPRHRHRTHGRIVGELALALLADVPQLRALRSEGPAVPHGRVVLRVPAAVLALSAGFRVRDRAALPARHACRQLPLRRHQDPDAGGAADAGRSGARLGAARCLRAAQGRRLLARPVRPRARPAQAGRQHGVVGHGCHLHRHQGHPAREEHPPRRGAHLCRALLRQRVAQDMAAAGARPGPARVLRRRHRWGLSRDGAVLQGSPERADPRGAVHPAQHRCDQIRVRPRRRREQAVRTEQRHHRRRLRTRPSR